MIYIMLADGFEEAEALVPCDILRRSGLETLLVTVKEEKKVTGSHGISVECDITAEEMKLEEMAMLLLPGGKKGVDNLDEYMKIDELLNYTKDKNRYFAAICAAPSILGKRGFLEGKKATCYPGFEKYLLGAKFTSKKVVIDGNIITASGAGAAYEFAFSIVETLCGKEKAKDIKNEIRY